MSITGTGTQADPYVIHDYSELIAVQTGKNTYWQSGADNIYILFAADIDMTGETWIDPSSSGSYCKFHLDLGGKTWSNIHLSGTQRLFYGIEIGNGTFDGLIAHEMQVSVFQTNYNDRLYLHDLTILNFECDYKPESGYGYYYLDCFGFFKCSTIERCNIDIVMHFPDENQAPYGTQYNGYSVFYNCSIIQNCDIHAVCDGNHAYYGRSVEKTSRQGIFKSCPSVQYCRVTGVLTDSDVPITEFINRDNGINYCVVDFDFSACTLADASVDCGLSVLIGGTSNTTVMDTDSLAAAGLYNKFTAGTGVIDCTYSEIRNYDDLTEKSFPVTEDLTSQTVWKIVNGSLPFQTSFPMPTKINKLAVGDDPVDKLYVGDIEILTAYFGDIMVLGEE